ncbi:putative class V chitinase [Mytilinidion resinicola]|uniref:chitinase n=1 Tax=Mytilinidion resinicola TaxID=574789 RepID=A0A6A6Y3Y3_9PEZI|nr:putative class V chitinase [Mytilinidion resinicola]KAF2803339.1 putative class V chitinase [Mytilinidion resinicola]
MYHDQWHPSRPGTAADRAGITHVVLSFAHANSPETYNPFVSVDTIRSEYGQDVKAMIAIGRWGEEAPGFAARVKDQAIMDAFAKAEYLMLQKTGADGVDIDWEYPGGNGQNYKTNAGNPANEIANFALFLAAIRKAIGTKILSIAVPGMSTDMMAYIDVTSPTIWPHMDFVNVMTYDLSNRRNTATSHHTSIKDSLDSVKRYIDIKLDATKINLGFAYYAKWFTTKGDCPTPLGCPLAQPEDPITGADTKLSGAVTFEKANMAPLPAAGSITVSSDGMCGANGHSCPVGSCCSEAGYCGTSDEYCKGGCQHAFSNSGCKDVDVLGSWAIARVKGVNDTTVRGQYYYDASEHLFWTWDTVKLVEQFKSIVKPLKLGGVMAWSLGEDSYDWGHVKTMAAKNK